MPQPLQNETYTYADYYEWDDGERWELIDGVPYAMSPAPTPRHQLILLELSLQFGNFLRGKPCKLFFAPFDVRLNPEDGDDTVVQPDLVVICDQTKIDGRGCVGAPDLVIEILSPSTARKDRSLKFRCYRQSGVREYWIVDPETRSVQVFVLQDGAYVAHVYTDTDDVPVTVLNGCVVNLSDVFA